MAVRALGIASAPSVPSQYSTSASGNGEVRFWFELIKYLNCREVLILDAFGFLARRPTFARRLFDRLTASGHRMAVWHHFEPTTVLRLPLPVHRLTIIVPIVMKPSATDGERNERQLTELFKQLTTSGTNFREHYSWLFLLEDGRHDELIQRFQHRPLPIRADSNVYSVRYCSDDRWFERVHLEWSNETNTRAVRRMQMIHPETGERRVQVDFWLRSSNGGKKDKREKSDQHPVDSGCGTLRQLYRLQTRRRTIDVAVELGMLEQGGEKMVLLPPRSVEQRNDFFNLGPGISIMVYSGVGQHVASMEVAKTVTLFRNVRTTIIPYKIEYKLRLTDFQLRLAIVNRVPTNLAPRARYSMTLFHEFLNVYISYQSADHGELMGDFVEIVLQPVLWMLVLFSFSFWIAFNCSIKYGPGNWQQPKLSMADSLICFVGVLAQQGSIVRPNSLATMLIIFVGLSICYIIYCCFLTRITSLLSVDVDEWEDLEGLLAANEYSIGYIGGLTDTSKQMHNPLIAEVLRRTQRDTTLPVGSLAEGLHRVLTSKYALLASQGVTRRITEFSVEGLYQSISIHMEPVDGYTKMINFEILRHHSNGVINRLEEKFISHSKSCIKRKVFEHIGMGDLRLPLILMLASIVLSAFVLVMEVAYHRFRLYRNRRARVFIEFCN
ncbi:uncharacterized protein LOC125959215 [Anopheles darlingi]|uniref:uncharacterized protein LOC125959215 n=1 Tax=Anopheles darlingi TaxID=43151 RepID=UPI0021001340|nr:uncharacterized protein LOC125959215 [Anopheles darlingi]